MTGLSKYIIYDKQKETDKQYSRSRNLVEPQVRESIGAIPRAAVDRIVETGDLTDLADRYPDYDIYKTQIDSFDAADPGAPPMSGTFVTVFLCRKAMTYNITGNITGGRR